MLDRKEASPYNYNDIMIQRSKGQESNACIWIPDFETRQNMSKESESSDYESCDDEGSA